jgi:PleD family two-component response regulator
MTYASDVSTNETGGKIQGESFRAMMPANAARTRILVADDQPDIREALRLLLKGEKFETDRPPRSCPLSRLANSMRS